MSRPGAGSFKSDARASRIINQSICKLHSFMNSCSFEMCENPSLFQLNPGDLCRIIAPAGAGSAGNLPLIRNYVESLGLVAQLRPDIYQPGDPFYSNTDAIRGEDLLDALLDPECKAVWCIRGGAGCIRLIPFLESQLPPASNPPSFKVLIGYSDITVLHLYLGKKYGWPTLHGPMLEAAVNGFYDPAGESMTALRSLLFSPVPRICEPTLTRMDDLGSGVNFPLQGVVVGGNLTLVETSIGTLFETDAAGKILFLEDVGEAAYSLERSLDHMKQAGIFNSALAVVFGDFTDPDSESLLTTALRRFSEGGGVSCPVFRLTGIGHGRTNFPLPLNTAAEIAVLNESQNTYRLCVDNLPQKED